MTGPHAPRGRAHAITLVASCRYVDNAPPPIDWLVRETEMRRRAARDAQIAPWFYAATIVAVGLAFGLPLIRALLP